MKKQRKHFTAEEKVSTLRQHLIDGIAVSDVCDERGISPNIYYRWQKEFFERGTQVFERDSGDHNRLSRHVSALETKLTRKNEVLAEVMEEHVALKKSHGVL